MLTRLLRPAAPSATALQRVAGSQDLRSIGGIGRRSQVAGDCDPEQALAAALLLEESRVNPLANASSLSSCSCLSLRTRPALPTCHRFRSSVRPSSCPGIAEPVESSSSRLPVWALCLLLRAARRCPCPSRACLALLSAGPLCPWPFEAGVCRTSSMSPGCPSPRRLAAACPSCARVFLPSIPSL